jgi:hypothetical protein
VRVRIVVAVGVVVLVGGCLLALVAVRSEEEARFCTTALAFGTDGAGRTVVLQDQGAPGRDGCEIDEVPDEATTGAAGDDVLVLGLDCSYRDAEGDVVATTEPNRPDGSCGQD